MSRNSQAKKARRKKRLAAREGAWLPEPLFEEIRAAAESDPVAEALGGVDEWITSRGWVLDSENADTVVSWVYPPSAVVFHDEAREPVTRIWIVVDESDDEVVLEFGAVLVGDGGDEDAYVLDPETLPDDIGVLESYRSGQPRPILD